MTSRSKVLDLNAGEPPSAAAGSTLRVKSDPAKSRQRLLTDIGYSAVVPNVTTANAFLKKIAGELDLTESVAVMSEKAKAASAGILTDLETMLAAQAVALKTVFNELARRASANMGEYLNYRGLPTPGVESTDAMPCHRTDLIRNEEHHNLLRS